MQRRAPSKTVESNDFQNVFRQLPERKLLIRANDPDFIIEDITDSYAAMINANRDDMMGKPYFQVFPDAGSEDAARISNLVRVFRKIIAVKEPQIQHVFRHDLPHPTKEGKMLERYWQTTLYPILDKDQKVSHILQVSSNATQEVLSLRELQETKHHLEEALEAGKVASWTLEIASGIVKGNSGTALLWGISQEKALSGLVLADFIEMIHKDDRERIVRTLQATIDSGEMFNAEFRVGRSKWMLGRGQVMKKDGLKIVSGVMVDVTELRDLKAKVNLARRQDRLNREAAKLLQKRNEELEAISKTKEEFVALASHQLRTPATAVKQYIGMVLQGYAGEVSSIQSDMLQKAFESNERQIQIINQILNTARADTGKLIMMPAPADVVQLLQVIVDDVRKTIEEHDHTLILDVPTHGVVLDIDPGYFRMAIENLLSNADKYTPQGGTITVSLQKKAKHIQVYVKDTGVGIADEDINKLFVKFSRIHNPLSIQAGGSGIGLYLAAEIIRLHGGTMQVNSKLGKGTTFSIELPLPSRS